MFPVAMADQSDFARAGYPTIAVVGGTFIFLYTIFYSATKTGYGAWRNHALWFFFNFWLWLFGLFLVFGPDSLASSVILTSTTGPRAAILGLQLMVQASIGAFAIFSANAYASLVFALFGIFNELGLIGSLWLFNYNQPIWTLNTTQCQAYFQQEINANGAVTKRCEDDGYLEFLRVIGTLEIIVNGYLIVVSLLAYATAVPAHLAQGGPAYGAPAATGYPATTTTTGAYAPATTTTTYANTAPYAAPTAGPGFVAQTGPTVSQPTTYTTSVPAQV